MKLRLILKTKTKKGKDIVIKLNIGPSKHLGFVNFINLCLSQGNDVDISFEKISKTGEVKSSTVKGAFKFEAIDKKELKELEDEVEAKEKQRKK